MKGYTLIELWIITILIITSVVVVGVNFSGSLASVQPDQIAAQVAVTLSKTVNGQKQVISDEGFQQYKQQGSILVDIKASTHSTILKDIQQRLESTLAKHSIAQP